MARNCAAMFGSRSTRAIIASALRWSAPALSGAISRKIRSTGRPSSASKSIAPLEPGEDAEDAVAFGELAVRDGDAVADSGRAQPLALQQRVEDFARRQARDLRGALAHFLQRLLLAVDAQRGKDRVGRKKVGQCHCRTRKRTCKARLRRDRARLMRIEPTDRAVGAPVDDVHARVAGVLEHQETARR